MNDQNSAVSFGDNVRIRMSPETQAAGVSGLPGQVHGETTPSVTGVSVIGACDNDYAINVFFEQISESFWFAPALVEFVDHGAGAEFTIKGVSKKWVRAENGHWLEKEMSKPWWRWW